MDTGASKWTQLVESDAMGLKFKRKVWSRNTDFGFSSQMMKEAMRRMRLPKESEKSCQSRAEQLGPL